MIGSGDISNEINNKVTEDLSNNLYSHFIVNCKCLYNIDTTN